MKKTNIYLCKTAIVGFFVFSSLISCKKKEELKYPSNNVVILKQAIDSNVSITDLKIYFGALTRLDTSQISYDINSEKFFIKGVEQLSFKELKENYLKFPLVHYKEGLSITKQFQNEN